MKDRGRIVHILGDSKEKLTKAEILDFVYKICIWSIGPLLLVMIVSLVIIFILSLTGCSVIQKNNVLNTLITLTIPYFLCMSVIPLRYIRKQKITFENCLLNFPKSNKAKIEGLLVTLVGLGALIIAGIINSFQVTFWLFFIHYLSVAVSEEILARGLIPYYLKKLFRRSIAVVVSALIFTFVFHSNSDIISNIFIRLPLGLIFGVIAERTKSIFPTICLHWGYDVLVTIVSI